MRGFCDQSALLDGSHLHHGSEVPSGMCFGQCVDVQEKGQVTIQESAGFSVTPLSGVYGIHAEMFDENKDQILCLDIEVPM